MTRVSIASSSSLVRVGQARGVLLRQSSLVRIARSRSKNTASTLKSCLSVVVGDQFLRLYVKPGSNPCRVEALP